MLHACYMLDTQTLITHYDIPQHFENAVGPGGATPPAKQPGTLRNQPGGIAKTRQTALRRQPKGVRRQPKGVPAPTF